ERDAGTAQAHSVARRAARPGLPGSPGHRRTNVGGVWQGSRRDPCHPRGAGRRAARQAARWGYRPSLRQARRAERAGRGLRMGRPRRCSRTTAPVRHRAGTVRLHAALRRSSGARRIRDARRGRFVVELVVADIGGSHARFALADVENGQVTNLGDAVTFRTVEHASLQTAWTTFGDQLGRALPRDAAIAVACPITGEMLKLTNNPWIIRPTLIGGRLGLDRFTLIN